LASRLEKIQISQRRPLKCYNCDMIGHTSLSCKKPRRNSNFKNKVNVIDDDEIKDILSKENTIYINGQLMKILADAHYNFIS
jgi:hypothetical protein